MPRRATYTETMAVLERRIAAGEYMLKDLPGERKIAEETGVSYMTARKAVLALIEKGVLAREENGTLMVAGERSKANPDVARVALLLPGYPSPFLTYLRNGVDRAAGGHPVQFRSFEYAHWDDGIFKESLDACDGVIIIPSTEPIPDRVMRSLTNEEHRVVMLDGDLAEHGIPSVRLFPDSHIRGLLAHLSEMGYDPISCLNTQGMNAEIERRIGLWRAHIDEHGIDGELWDDPTPPYEDPMVRAHAVMRRRIEARGGALGAVVCTTQPAALGAMRACYESGLVVGRDVAICTVNNEPTGWYFCPSLTGLEAPAFGPLLEPCFGWFAGKDDAWDGDLLIEPGDIPLFIGESTDPSRAVASR
jgi:DNA-binding LacI/PurR family transcriptional regulator